MKPIKVLSLFDGISCGQVALQRAGIPLEVYYASEIDKFAIQVTQKNYPNTIQLGDVEKVDFKQFEGKIDLLIGGSPCTNLSICGNRKGLEGDESRLFFEFVRAIKECNPKYFFLENVASMSDKDKEIISQELGCYPIMINSSLVSAQNRRRYYWFNWGDKQYNLFGMPTCDIPQPKDKKIVLKDILENGYGINCLKYGKTLTKKVDKSVALCARDYKGFRNIQESTGVLEPLIPYVEKQYEKSQIKNGEIPALFNPYNCQKIEDKAPTLTTYCGRQSSSSAVMLFDPICINFPEIVKVRKYEVDIDNLKKILKEHKTLSNKEIAEKLNYPITTVEHWFRTDKSFSIPPSEIWIKLKELLNIKTDIFDKSIMEFEKRLGNYEKSTRKYYVNGKMSTLTCGNNDEIIEPCIYQLPHGYNKGAIIKDKAPTMTVSAWEHNNKICESVQIGNIGSNAQAHRIYSIRGKSITLNANGGGQGGKTGLYKIDLPDGDYIIRKLTPLECERLQTLNDNYTEGISNSQRYKCIGNGWTVDVIVHIFKFLKNEL